MFDWVVTQNSKKEAISACLAVFCNNTGSLLYNRTNRKLLWLWERDMLGKGKELKRTEDMNSRVADRGGSVRRGVHEVLFRVFSPDRRYGVTFIVLLCMERELLYWHRGKRVWAALWFQRSKAAVRWDWESVHCSLKTQMGSLGKLQGLKLRRLTRGRWGREGFLSSPTSCYFKTPLMTLPFFLSAVAPFSAWPPQVNHRKMAGKITKEEVEEMRLTFQKIGE